MSIISITGKKKKSREEAQFWNQITVQVLALLLLLWASVFFFEPPPVVVPWKEMLSVTQFVLPSPCMGSSRPGCPFPPSSLLWPHCYWFLVYLIPIACSHSSELGLKSIFMWGLFWTIKPSPLPLFLFFVACVNLSFCTLWFNSIHLSILDYKLTEGRNSILSFAGGFGMVSDKKTAALTKFKNGALRTVGIMKVCPVCSEGI